MRVRMVFLGELSLRSISSHGVQKRLSLDDAEDVNWAHAWLAAKRGQLSFRDRSFVYLLKDGKNGVETTRLSITQLPRPRLPLLGVLATLLILAMWLVSVRMRHPDARFFFGSVVFIAVWVMTIVWCFVHAWQAIENLVPDALSSSQIGESMLVVSLCVGSDRDRGSLRNEK